MKAKSNLKIRSNKSQQLGPSAQIVDTARTYRTLLFHDGFRALEYQLSVTPL